MRYNFDRIIERTGTDSLKWDGREAIFGRSDLLPLWVADMDFAAPPAVVTALKTRAKHPVYGYPLRTPAIDQAIIGWLKKRHDWMVEAEWLLLTNGVVPALNLAVLAFTEPGDKVIIQPPVYQPFFKAVENNKRQLVLNQLREENGRYTIDFAHLEQIVDRRTKMLIFCSPHNPVGRVWTREELTKLGQFCLEHRILLVADEIHSDLVYKEYTHTPLASLTPELADNTITCIAPSKTFNVPGLATAVAIVPDKARRERFRQIMAATGVGAGNLFGLCALQAAYQEGEDWLEALLDYLQGNLELMTEFVAERLPGLKVIKPEGTYLVWLDCRGLGLTPEQLSAFLINEAKVGFNDGRGFGPGGAGFQRVNIACPRAVLKEALSRIERAVRQL
ncbi:MAG: putative C-S lyase [Firmicutes bacterium]|nr:putative C-S lyase [Bacillota bacterium]